MISRLRQASYKYPKTFTRFSSQGCSDLCITDEVASRPMLIFDILVTQVHFVPPLLSTERSRDLTMRQRKHDLVTEHSLRPKMLDNSLFSSLRPADAWIYGYIHTYTRVANVASPIASCKWPFLTEPLTETYCLQRNYGEPWPADLARDTRLCNKGDTSAFL